MQEVWILTYHDLSHVPTILGVYASDVDVMKVIPGLAKMINEIFGTIPNNDPGEPYREEGRISWKCLRARRFRVQGETRGSQELGTAAEENYETRI